MLKQIKTLGLSIVIGMMMVGCSGEKFEVTLEGYEREIVQLMDDYYDIEIKLDKETNEQTLETVNNEMDKVKEVKSDLDKELKDYERGTDEYRLLDSLYNLTNELEDCYDVYVEVITLDIEGSMDPLTMITTAASGVDEELEMEEEFEEYKELKKELGIEDVLESTEMEEEQETKEVAEQEKPEEQKQEEKKVETKQTYCEWCEANTNHNSNEHIGQCYDCGEEKPAGQMTYNGRSFHCGCIVAYCEECGSGLTEESKVKMGDMLFCRSCYDNRMALTEPVAECYECGTGMTAAHDIYYYFDQPVCSACYNSLTSNNCSVCGGDTEGNDIYHNDARYCLDCYMEAVEGLEN